LKLSFFFFFYNRRRCIGICMLQRD